MFCGNCGEENLSTDSFCKRCGAPLSGNKRTSANAAPLEGFNPNMGFNMSMTRDSKPFAVNPLAAIKTRSVVICILLCYITFAIYLYYWIYSLTRDTNKIGAAVNSKTQTSGGCVILFTIITCGIYLWYWFFKRGEVLDEYNKIYNGYPSNNRLLYLLLSIFGLHIIAFGLMQHEINIISRRCSQQ